MRLKTELLAAELAARVPALAGESPTNRAEAIKCVIQQHMVVEQSPAKQLSDEEVWLKVWLSCAAASNATEASTCTTWADRCLKDFKERFRK